MVWRKWAQTIQWTRVSLVPRGTLQVRIPFMRQWSDPTLEQTNKQQIAQESLSTNIQGNQSVRTLDQTNINF